MLELVEAVEESLSLYMEGKHDSLSLTMRRLNELKKAVAQGEEPTPVKPRIVFDKDNNRYVFVR